MKRSKAMNTILALKKGGTLLTKKAPMGVTHPRKLTPLKISSRWIPMTGDGPDDDADAHQDNHTGMS